MTIINDLLFESTNTSNYTEGKCTLTIDAINFYLMLFGIVSNILCICILLNRNLRKRKFNFYLLVLANVELIFCIIVFIGYLCYVVPMKSILMIDLLSYFLIHFTDSFAVNITLLLSVDRLYAVQCPISVKNFITNKRPKLLILISALIVLIIILPYIVLFVLNHSFSITYSTLISPLVLNFLPAMIILVINTILFRKIIIYERRKRRTSLNFTMKLKVKSRTTQNESDVSTGGKIFPQASYYKPMTQAQKSHFLVIIVIAGWLLFTTIPYHFILWIAHFNTSYVNFQHISSVLFNSNHCINIFIYFCFHDSFRMAFLNVFKRLWPKSIKCCSFCDKVNKRENDEIESLSFNSGFDRKNVTNTIRSNS